MVTHTVALLLAAQQTMNPYSLQTAHPNAHEAFQGSGFLGCEVACFLGLRAGARKDTRAHISSLHN